MAKFNYEQSIWGARTASQRWSDPASFRLKECLKVLQNLPAGSKVLEIGCGAGQFIRAIKKIHPEWECFGSDISESAITQAKKANDGVVYNLSSTILPYTDESFSAVLVFDVLEHVDNPDLVLSEMVRVLQSGGRVYSFIPCEGDVLSWWYWLGKFSFFKDLTNKYAGHINHWSRKKWLEVFTKNGLLVRSVENSEHILGQAIGVLSFCLMDRRVRKTGEKQINNESFFSTISSTGLIGMVKKIINSAIYFESFLWQKIPSPNIHINAEKQSVKETNKNFAMFGLEVEQT